MKKDSRTLVEYRLKRARESLEEAQILLNSDKLHSTVNRTYYALFYSVNALLLSKSLSSSKHSGVEVLFRKEFVKKGLIEKESGQFYSEMFKRRQKGDYEDLVEFHREDVVGWIEKAEDFVDKIEKLLIEYYS